MPLFLKNLDTDIDIFGDRQNFHFNDEDAPVYNKASLSLINHFVANSSTNVESSFDLLDKNLNGFRLVHEKSENDTYGNISLQKYSVFGTQEKLLEYEEIKDELLFAKDVVFANGKILDMANNKITDLGTPTDSTDAATKAYVDNAASTGVSSVGITSSDGMDVTGSPITGSGVIDLSLHVNLRNLAAQTSTGFISKTSTSYIGRSLVGGNGISINNSDGIAGNPTIYTDNVPISSLSGYPANASLYLTGDGNWKDPFIFENSLDMGSNKITDLGTPTDSTDAATKAYVDNAAATGVSSVGITSSYGMDVTGSPITGSGVIDLSLHVNLRNLAAQTSTGFMSRTPASYIGRSLVGGNGISINNSDGIAGNPTIYTDNVPISSLSGYPTNGFLYLTGDGFWRDPFISPVVVTGSEAGDFGFFVYNNNSSNLGFGYSAFNSNTNQGVEFGMNNQTNEGFIFGTTTVSLKFGTNALTRMKLETNGHLNMYANKITNVGTPTASTDVATKAYVDSASGGGASFEPNAINVNTTGGSDHWLRRSNTTTTGTIIYGQNSNSFVFEQRLGESGGIATNGDSDGTTIWSPGDSGAYLNIQDEDSTNTRLAYVASGSGQWTVVSSKTRKHSIADKANNNVLDRFLNLSVKSYGYKYPPSKKTSKKALDRINKKTNKMQIGLILEELFEIFPNCMPDYYNSLFKNKKTKDKLILEEEIKDISNSGIDYNTLLCYFIMAFQEYVAKNNKEIAQLKKENNK